MDAKLCTARWRLTILNQSRLLKRNKEQYTLLALSNDDLTKPLRIADEIKVISIAGPKKLHYRKQLSILRKREVVIKNQIKADLQQCSGQQLAPLLSKIQALLPLEFRESIYEHIFDTSKPIVLPRTENSNSTFTGTHSDSDEASGQSKVKYVDLDPFIHGYCFSATVMGAQTTTEVRNLVLRKTPFYFSGSKNAPYVKDLLDIEVQPGRYFRDLVRHLRFHFRCETFRSDAKYRAPGVSAGTTEPSSEHTPFDQPATYDMYWARLDGLETLNYANHTVMLEICVFTEETSQQSSIKRNLYGMIEQVYIHANNGGADMKVRYEDFSTGNGEDWTEYLATSGQQWIQSKQPKRALEKTPPSSASLSRDLFDAPIPTSEANISWKQGLFDGNIPQCHCEPCERFSKRICPSCGNAHAVALNIKDQEGSNNAWVPRRRVRRRPRNEQRAEADGHGQASGS